MNSPSEKSVAMLLKWLFTFLALAWLYQAIKPFFVINQGQNGPVPKKRDKDDDNGEYIDYEEIK